jgi:hypothetical protein
MDKDDGSWICPPVRSALSTHLFLAFPGASSESIPRRGFESPRGPEGLLTVEITGVLRVAQDAATPYQAAIL